MTQAPELTFHPDAAYFEGHFEGAPILPAMAQLVFVRAALARWDGGLRIVGVAALRLRAPALPGEALGVRFPERPGAGKLRFDIVRDGVVISQGVLRVERAD